MRKHLRPFRRAWRVPVLAAASCLPLVGCAAVSDEAVPDSSDVRCDAEDGGLTLPAGFCALVFADDLGSPRHLVVRQDGALFAAIRNRRDVRGGIVALRDTDGDGRADQHARFGENGGTGLYLVDDTLLYFGADDAVLRYRLPPGELTPAGPPDTIVHGLPSNPGHGAKSISVAGSRLFVNHGSASNACQLQDRESRSFGREPCSELSTRAGVWVYDANLLRQRPNEERRFATGIRNLVAQTIGPDGRLYGVQHGRDQLGASWGFSDRANAELPAEEMLRIAEGDDYGWPYCYYDGNAGRRVLAPEYGGDGSAVGRCDRYDLPIESFPAHWAPNAIRFYDGASFPDRFHGGAFVAFHGSWNRAPLPQEGYNVVFVPFEDGEPSGEWEVFAEGFAGSGSLPGNAEHRPSGLAVGPDGSLFIGDDTGGTIWRVVHTGAEAVAP